MFKRIFTAALSIALICLVSLAAGLLVQVVIYFFKLGFNFGR